MLDNSDNTIQRIFNFLDISEDQLPYFNFPQEMQLNGDYICQYQGLWHHIKMKNGKSVYQSSSILQEEVEYNFLLSVKEHICSSKEAEWHFLTIINSEFCNLHKGQSTPCVVCGELTECNRYNDV